MTEGAGGKNCQNIDYVICERPLITYLICVFDTTWESKFGHQNSYFLANFVLIHADLKAIKAFDPVKKVSVLYLLRLLRNVVLKFCRGVSKMVTDIL